MTICDRCYTLTCGLIENDECSNYYQMDTTTNYPDVKGKTCEVDTSIGAFGSGRCTASTTAEYAVGGNASVQCDLPAGIGPPPNLNTRYRHGDSCELDVIYGCEPITCNDGYTNIRDVGSLSGDDAVYLAQSVIDRVWDDGECNEGEYCEADFQIRGHDICCNSDCVGSWSDCTAECETAAARTWTETQPHSGNGAACPTAVDCQPGEDACPLAGTPPAGTPPAGSGSGNSTTEAHGNDGLVVAGFSCSVVVAIILCCSFLYAKAKG